MNTLKGIDVSAHQGVIDWKQVKEDGIEFAIIRAGYGNGNVDKYFKANIEKAIANGIKVGVYWFIYALNDNDIMKNANGCLKTIEPYKKHIAMKVWCDLEYDSDAYANKHGLVLTKSIRTHWVTLFLETIKAQGYEVGNYSNPDYLKGKFNAMDYPLWLAQYSTKKSYDCLMWQCSSKGAVNGIKGNVDLDIYYDDTIVKEEYEVPTRTLKKTVIPMRGEDVKWVQNKLIIKGCLPSLNAKGKSNTDGIYGNDTKNAVVSFQKMVFPNNPNEWDGIVGKKTVEKFK